MNDEDSDETHALPADAPELPDVHEPPTEPLPPELAAMSASAALAASKAAEPPAPAIPLETNPAYVPHVANAPAPPPPAPVKKSELPMKPSVTPAPLASSLAGPFAQTRYRFTTGLRAGEVANIRGEDGRVLLSYRSFASVIGIVAALVSGIVALAGLAAVLFLFNEGYPLRAVAALALTLIFAFFIALLVPRANVTLYDEHHPALMLAQRSHLPSVRYEVSTPNGSKLAEFRKARFARLGRHRWSILHEGRVFAEAREESWRRAMVRKVLGKFHRRFETNFVLEHGGLPAGRIVRRPDATGAVDFLEVTNDALDRRVAVALATVILGREP